MHNDFETPDAAPEGTSLESPIQYELNFKSGKTPEGYAAMATPDLAKAGFSYYSKTQQQRVKLDSVTLYVVGVYVQLGGDFPSGTDGKFRHFASNLVTDLRDQKIEFREQYIKGGGLRCWGTKEEVKAWAKMQHLPDTATSFRVVLVCVSPDFNGLVELQCSQRIEAAMKAAIGASTGTFPKSGFVFNLCAISTKFWGFQFKGNFIKKDKEGQDWNGKGEMYYQPVFDGCGIITKDGNPAKWEQLNRSAEEVRQFVENLSERLQKRSEKAQPDAGQPAPEYYQQPQAGIPAPPPTGGYPVAPPPVQHPVAASAAQLNIPSAPAGFPQEIPAVGDINDLPF